MAIGTPSGFEQFLAKWEAPYTIAVRTNKTMLPKAAWPPELLPGNDDEEPNCEDRHREIVCPSLWILQCPDRPVAPSEDECERSEERAQLDAENPQSDSTILSKSRFENLCCHSHEKRDAEARGGVKSGSHLEPFVNSI